MHTLHQVMYNAMYVSATDKRTAGPHSDPLHYLHRRLPAGPLGKYVGETRNGIQQSADSAYISVLVLPLALAPLRAELALMEQEMEVSLEARYIQPILCAGWRIAAPCSQRGELC